MACRYQKVAKSKGSKNKPNMYQIAPTLPSMIPFGLCPYYQSGTFCYLSKISLHINGLCHLLFNCCTVSEASQLVGPPVNGVYVGTIPMTHPWDDCIIYLHENQKSNHSCHVGKFTSPMDPTGFSAKKDAAKACCCCTTSN